MKLFNIYIKKSANGAINDLIMVKNGFSFWAFGFGLLWFLYRKMWRPAIIILLITSLLFYIQDRQIFTDYALTVISLAVSLIIGLNANYWYENYLKQRQYQFFGCIFGKNSALAKLRFIENYLVIHPQDSELFCESLFYPDIKSTNA
jgi:hypothetical protein